MKALFRNPFFLSGFVIVLLLIVSSFLYSFVLKDYIPDPPRLVYGEGRRLIDAPPYPPSLKHPFGVTRQTEDVFWKVIDGAKYTIGIALIVSLLRVFLSLIGGIIHAFYLQFLNPVIDAFVRVFRAIPTVFLVMLFLLVENYNIRSGMVILTVVAIPPLANVIQVEIKQFLKNDFITCSRTLGASNCWLLFKHVMPYLRTRLILFYAQQIVQTLFVIVQLGAFQVILGGLKDVSADDISDVSNPHLSKTNEWSGVIGLSYRELMLDKWIVVGPCIGFVVAIFAFNLIVKGVEQSSVKREL